MILYNVTLNIEESIQDDWLIWMKNKHIPDVMNTGLFKGHKILKLKEPKPESGITYSVQYFCDSMEKLNLYFEKKAPALQAEHTERYKTKFVAFRTILEII